MLYLQIDKRFCLAVLFLHLQPWIDCTRKTRECLVYITLRVIRVHPEMKDRFEEAVALNTAAAFTGTALLGSII